jgi:hypothetical protein
MAAAQLFPLETSRPGAGITRLINLANPLSSVGLAGTPELF